MKRMFRCFILFSLVVLAMVPTMPVSAIQNGQPDGNNHPYVVLVVFYDEDHTPLWRTSGELLSPRVVLTAGHGTIDTTYAAVWFEPNINPNNSTTFPFDVTGYPVYGGGTSVTGIPYTNPDYRAIPNPGLPGFDYHDVGVVVLDENAPVTSYAALPSAGVVNTLPAMARVDLVGYGVTSQVRGGGTLPQDSWRWNRLRNFALANLVQSKDVLSSEFLKLTANPGLGKGGTTFGDSGGPILNGGTNIILGINSFVTNYNCDGVTYAQRIDIPDILDWINSFP